MSGLLGRLINGKVFDFSSIKISVNGPIFTNVQEISYSDSLEPGILRGTSALKQGRTRGEYNAEGSISIYKGDAAVLKTALAALGLGGFMEAEFDIIVTYAEVAAAVPVVDTLRGCRITNADNSHSQGSDPLQETFDLDIMEISYGGVSAVSVTAGGGIGGIVGGLLP